jgi:FlaG/FlaF family flagellin (archaellin)
MRMILLGRVRRRAISAILAEVMLIAVVLVEAIAIVDFAVGLFGSFVHTAGLCVRDVIQR